MRVMVTGATGFVGGHVVHRLLAEGHEVVALVRPSSATSGLPPDVDRVAADLRDAAALLQAVRSSGATHVSHQAAHVASGPAANRDVVAMARTNILGTLNLLEACRRVDVEGVVLASTAAPIYGPPKEPAVGSREGDPLVPVSGYGASKAAMEAYARAYAMEHGLSTCVLRYANVYGAFLDGRGLAGLPGLFIERCLAGNPITIFGREAAGDGGGVRDHVHVEDVAVANVHALGGGFGWMPEGDAVVNVATGRSVTTAEVLDLVVAATQRAPDVEQAGPRSGDHAVSRLCVDRAADLGWRAAVDLEGGIARLVAERPLR